MSKKTKQVIAIVALVFMAVFTVTFVLWLAAPKLWNGQFGWWALVSGCAGVGLFLLVKLVKTPEEKSQEKRPDYLPDAEASDALGDGMQADSAKEDEQGDIAAHDDTKKGAS